MQTEDTFLETKSNMVSSLEVSKKQKLVKACESILPGNCYYYLTFAELSTPQDSQAETDVPKFLLDATLH